MKIFQNILDWFPTIDKFHTVISSILLSSIQDFRISELLENLEQIHIVYMISVLKYFQPHNSVLTAGKGLNLLDSFE